MRYTTWGAGSGGCGHIHGSESDAQQCIWRAMNGMSRFRMRRFNREVRQLEEGEQLPKNLYVKVGKPLDPASGTMTDEEAEAEFQKWLGNPTRIGM